jgi:hypothetical protein
MSPPTVAKYYVANNENFSFASPHTESIAQTLRLEKY